jgi:hypothetical protein
MTWLGWRGPQGRQQGPYEDQALESCIWTLIVSNTVMVLLQLLGPQEQGGLQGRPRLWKLVRNYRLYFFLTVCSGSLRRVNLFLCSVLFWLSTSLFSLHLSFLDAPASSCRVWNGPADCYLVSMIPNIWVLRLPDGYSWPPSAVRILSCLPPLPLSCSFLPSGPF